MITVIASHSLTMANQLYEEKIPHILLSLTDHHEEEILKCLNEMAKHGNNLARKVFEIEELSLTRALFEHGNKSQPIAIVFLSNLLRLGCAIGHTASLMSRLVQDVKIYHPILSAYFIASPKTKKSFEQLGAIVRSIELDGGVAHLSLLTLLIKIGTKEKIDIFYFQKIAILLISASFSYIK